MDSGGMVSRPRRMSLNTGVAWVVRTRFARSLWGPLVIVAVATFIIALGKALPAMKDYVARRLGDVILDGFGPASTDYSFKLVNGFSLFRSSSISRSVIGPVRSTGPHSETEFWVDPDVTYLGWNNRFIICFQDSSALSPRDAGICGWWILDTLSLSRYGPLEEDEFLQKAQELGIGQTVEVHKVEDYGRDGGLRK